MIVAVTQEHIDKGWRNDAGGCALALAIDAATGLGSLVSVYSISFYDEDGYLGSTGHTEQTARFITDFDRGEPVTPFEFELAWEAA